MVEKMYERFVSGVKKPGGDDEIDGLSEKETAEYYRRSASNDFPAAARPEAFDGIAGEVTKSTADNSELMPESVLAQFLWIT